MTLTTLSFGQMQVTTTNTDEFNYIAWCGIETRHRDVKNKLKTIVIHKVGAHSGSNRSSTCLSAEDCSEVKNHRRFVDDPR